ncbi:hypothetical protein ACN20G_11915 [Streptomyces sp. BI20]|uniref:hypothetical protein n=1 Tax=Streptomyces sp. BI20 TaxID=3403460 RepID=UPI003C73A8B7
MAGIDKEAYLDEVSTRVLDMWILARDEEMVEEGGVSPVGTESDPRMVRNGFSGDSPFRKYREYPSGTFEVLMAAAMSLAKELADGACSSCGWRGQLFVKRLGSPVVEGEVFHWLRSQGLRAREVPPPWFVPWDFVMVCPNCHLKYSGRGMWKHLRASRAQLDLLPNAPVAYRRYVDLISQVADLSCLPLNAIAAVLDMTVEDAWYGQEG